jgi:DNA-directed RNA polymerase subunit H
MTLEITKHSLIPKHTKISEAEKTKVLEKYNIDAASLPKILSNDPALTKMDVKSGDIIKIERKSKTAGVTEYYRLVIDA